MQGCQMPKGRLRRALGHRPPRTFARTKGRPCTGMLDVQTRPFATQLRYYA
jgi:hypothetical protein